MTMQEAARQAWRNLKGKPLKDKISHILTYYWIPIIACVCAVGLISTLVSSAVNKKDVLLSGYCINVKNTEYLNDFLQDFREFAQLTDKQEASFLSNLSTNEASIADTLQTLTIHSAAKDIDFLASDKKTCQSLLCYGYYWDLSQLPEPQKALLTPYFLYTERADLEQNFALEGAKMPVLGEKGSFSDPVAVALRLPDGNPLTKAYTFQDNEAVLLLLPNSQRLEMLYTLLDYLI